MLNLDTHILLYAVTGQLTHPERDLLSKDTWSISSIVLWEITRLYQKKRIDFGVDEPALAHVLQRIFTWEITPPMCLKLMMLDFESDPADQIIAATSLHHEVPLVTRDRKIRSSKIIPLAL